MSSVLTDHSTRQLLLVRYYLELSSGQVSLHGEVAKFAVVNLLHEALEACLIACADHLNINVGQKAGIEQYLDAIDRSIENSKLPFRSRIMQFNRARVSVKHALTLPDDRALIGFCEVIPEFVKQAVQTVFGADLDSVSLSNMVENEEVRLYIQNGERALADGRGFDGLAEVRKAFFCNFEKSYDTSVFVGTDDREVYGLLDDRTLCSSPSYAKSAGYVSERVNTPFDYIVLDHQKIDAECLIDGIDVHQFWNIWRLTPSVWRRKDQSWLVRYDLSIVDNPNILEDLRYVLNAIISVNIKIQRNRQKARYNQGAFKAIGIKPGTVLWRRASSTSEIQSSVPEDMSVLCVTEAVQGLDSDDWFWKVFDLQKGGPFLTGFLRQEDTVGPLRDFHVPSLLTGTLEFKESE